jgi:acyl-CoA thioesterase-2
MSEAATAASPASSDQPALDDLIRLLDLERIEENIFRGVSPESRLQRVFGGQVAGQALVAAGRSVDPARQVHSLHAYFMRPGDPGTPIVYQVDRVRDGRSFATRRVTGIQHGKAIFALSASFQVAEQGLEHQPSMPDVPPPEDLPTLDERFGDRAHTMPLLQLPRPIDLRFVTDPTWDPAGQYPPDGLHTVWMRANGNLPDDPLLHVCVLTYASDMTLLDTARARHGVAWGPSGVMMASLDHAMWFLHPVKADEWFLYAMESPAAAGGRGLATGRFFDRDGNHLVSAVQEGLIRVRRSPT